MWLGPSQLEAVAAFRRARRAGMSLARALVVGQIASFRDCWAFRRKLARLLGVSVRTIQRAISEAKSLGLLRVFRAKPNEKAPELGKVVPCGWSHRLTVRWGKAGAAVTEAIEAARLRFIARSVVATAARSSSVAPPSSGTRTAPRSSSSAQQWPRGHWTAERLDRELERTAPSIVARARAPDED